MRLQWFAVSQSSLLRISNSVTLSARASESDLLSKKISGTTPAYGLQVGLAGLTPSLPATVSKEIPGCECKESIFRSYNNRSIFYTVHLFWKRARAHTHSPPKKQQQQQQQQQQHTKPKNTHIPNKTKNNRKNPDPPNNNNNNNKQTNKKQKQKTATTTNKQTKT